MSRAHHQRVRAVFAEVCDLDDADRRRALDELCAEDDALRREVEAMLARDAAGPFIIDTPHETPLPERIGRYRVLSALGEGGMGVVYLAEQESPKRRVALKVIRAGFASPRALRRFRQESAILARLRHPGIAQIHEAGAHEGLPYFAMELVEGERLLEDAERRGLSRRERIELFLKVCDAVHHAHQHGVIHRDLKPANILVDETGQPKVLDFGVARLIDPDGQTVSQVTVAGQLVGTLPYMSPEQASGDVQEPDTRSDVYSLGVILHELLTGRPPFSVENRSFTETLRIIRDDPPTSLATIDRSFRGDLDTIVGHALRKTPAERYPSVSALAADLRRHLDNEPIAARRPSAWYQLGKFARRHKAASVAIGAVAAAIVMVAALGVAFGVRAERARDRAEDLAYAAGLAAAASDLAAGDAASARLWLHQRIDPSRRGAWEWRHLAARVDRSLKTLPIEPHGYMGLAISPDGRIMATIERDDSGPVLRLRSAAGDRAVLSSTPLDDPEAELAFSSDSKRLIGGKRALWCWDVSDPHRPREVVGGASLPVHIIGIEAGSDGLFVFGDNFGDVRMLRIGEDGARLTGAVKAHDGFVRSIVFDQERQRLFTASNDMSVKIWDVSDPSSPELLAAIPAHNEHVLCLAYAPAVGLLASGSVDERIRLWDVDAAIRAAEQREGVWIDRRDALAGELVGHERGVQALAFSPDGARLASGGADRAVALWEINILRESWDIPSFRDRWMIRRLTEHRLAARFFGHPGAVRSLVYAPDGRTVVSTAYDGTLKIWPAAATVEAPVLRGHRSGLHALAFSPDGRRLLSGSNDTWMMLWNVERCARLRTLHTLRDSVSSVAWRRDGRMIAAISNDGELVTQWMNGDEPGDVHARLDIPVGDGAPEEHYNVAFSPSGTSLAASVNGPAALLWRVTEDGLQPAHEIPAERGVVAGVAYSPDGRYFAICEGELDGNDGSVRVFDASSMRELTTLPVPGGALRAHFNRNAGLLAVISLDGAVMMRRTSDWKELWRTPPKDMGALSVAFHPEEPRIAIGAYNGLVQIRSTRSGEGFGTLTFNEHTGKIHEIAFSPDGRRLATVSTGAFGADNVVRLWETELDDAVIRGRIETERLSRRAATLVDDLLDAHVAAAEVVEALERDDALDPALRAAAIRLARVEGDHPGRLIDAAWPVVFCPNGSPPEYELALRRAEHALRLLPPRHRSRPAATLTVALARHRVGDYAGALRELDASEPFMIVADVMGSRSLADPLEDAVRALALAALGEDKAARQRRRAAMAAMERLGVSRDPDADRLIGELDEMIGAPDAALVR